MAVTTLDSFAGQAADKARKPGLFARMYRAFVISKEREARRHINMYLRSLDDRTLADLGFDRVKLANSDDGFIYRH